jgi:translocation protein SEC63
MMMMGIAMMQTAKKNWEEFGNPDGKQALEVSIGLPTFLLEKDNHNAILMVYLFILVIVIPVIVGAWYANSKQYGENNVMYDTYSFFIKMLSEHTNVKMLPEVLTSTVFSSSWLKCARRCGKRADVAGAGTDTFGSCLRDSSACRERSRRL